MFDKKPYCSCFAPNIVSFSCRSCASSVKSYQEKLMFDPKSLRLYVKMLMISSGGQYIGNLEGIIVKVTVGLGC